MPNNINLKKSYFNIGLPIPFGDLVQEHLVKSNSEYLVRNPVQAALPSNKRQKAKHFFEYFWLGMTLRPEGSRNLF